MNVDEFMARILFIADLAEAEASAANARDPEVFATMLAKLTQIHVLLRGYSTSRFGEATAEASEKSPLDEPEFAAYSREVRFMTPEQQVVEIYGRVSALYAAVVGAGQAATDRKRAEEKREKGELM